MADIPHQHSWGWVFLPEGDRAINWILPDNRTWTPYTIVTDTPTVRADAWGPPRSRNDLKDYDAGWFLHGPFTELKWEWFRDQLGPFITAGRFLPEVETFYQEFKDAIHPSINTYDPFGTKRLFAGIHDVMHLARPSLMQNIKTPLTWSLPWFEAAIEVIRAGWPYRTTQRWTREINWVTLVRWRFEVASMHIITKTVQYYVNKTSGNVHPSQIVASQSFSNIRSLVCPDHTWSGKVEFNIPEDYEIYQRAITASGELTGPNGTETFSYPATSAVDSVACMLNRYSSGSVSGTGSSILPSYTPQIYTTTVTRTGD